jgi:hypothetical protein
VVTSTDPTYGATINATLCDGTSYYDPGMFGTQTICVQSITVSGGDYTNGGACSVETTTTTTEAPTTTTTTTLAPGETTTTTTTSAPIVEIYVTNASLDAPITDVTINGVSITWVSGGDGFPLPAGENGYFTSAQIGLCDIVVYYGGHTSGQNIVIIDSESASTCCNLNGSTGTCTFVSATTNTTTAVSITASDGICS